MVENILRLALSHEMGSEKKFELTFKDLFSDEEMNRVSNFSCKIQPSEDPHEMWSCLVWFV
jgi:hypothetical protein